MIFDWYRNGEWGEIPVCRLGHIMADLVNASYVLYDYVSTPGPYAAPQYKRGNGNVIPYTTAPNAEASWWDGIPVTSEIIRTNYREALEFLEGLTEERSEVASRFVSDDYKTVITAEELGIADMDADTLTRPHEAWVWAKLRTAMERCRYLRRADAFAVEREYGSERVIREDEKPDGLPPTAAQKTGYVNTALADAWSGLSYVTEEVSEPVVVMRSFVTGQSVFYPRVPPLVPYTNSVAEVTRTESVTVIFRGEYEYSPRMLNLPVVYARLTLKFVQPPPSLEVTDEKTSLDTNQGAISGSVEFEYFDQDFTTFTLEESYPYSFPDASISDPAVIYTVWYSVEHDPAVPELTVYDIDGDPAS